MQNTADIYLQNAKQNHSRRLWIRQVLVSLSLFVVLGVFWGLKLTGITMAGEAFCGHEEHVHDDSCPVRIQICDTEESEAHMHTEECILRELICEEEECEAHAHGVECYTKTLTCELEESAGHTHNEECHAKELACDLPEEPAHLHDPNCYRKNLTCTLTEAPAHFHNQSCHTERIVCGQSESETHSHDSSCILLETTCPLPETQGHSHDNGCYTESLICTTAETAGHSHSESCYNILPDLCCEQEEHPAHIHKDGCYLIDHNEVTCGKEETEGHIHEHDCYEYGIGFGCEKTEAEGHIHEIECITPETQFDCEKEITEGHTHTDACYNILDACPLEEHVHDPSCYSDLTADLETEDDWEMSLSEITRSSNTAKNVLSVAQSQLGNRESTINFQVDETDVRRGITRYGQWFGNPYGDWSAMFTSFCLYYAGVDAPFSSGPETMRLEWEEEDLYVPAADYAPLVGHVLFLDRNEDGKADATGIISRYDNETIWLIEGDVKTGTEEEPFHAVMETDIPVDDPSILGYGLIQDDSALMVLPASDTSIIATTTTYSANMLKTDSAFVLYVTSGSNNYAFDGSGNAVPVYIDSEGRISTDAENPETLLWQFTQSSGNNNYIIQNLATKRYMHAHSGGVTTSTEYTSTVVADRNNVRIRSNTEYARLDAGSGTFVMTQNQNLAANYKFGVRSQCTVWFDGTCGGMMSYGGSPDEPYHVPIGDTIVLPEEWESPVKYSYRLRGWYDIINHEYYKPGDEVVVTENMVFYADWGAASYNIGQYNALVADTVSTNDFITTRIFDYGVLFNTLSETVNVTVDATSHSETWSLVQSGKHPVLGTDTLNFIFRDWDKGNEDISYPSNYNDQNHYTGNGITRGLYSSRLRDLLFNPGTEVVGKQYLGTADHLFQYMDDPSHQYYGYYYYDSDLNAASYNQSAGRFYVYDYLERTSDSANADGTGKYSDFLPLNSPYANTAGKNYTTYSYAGQHGEYNGVAHYMYDGKYNSGSDTPNHVGTNFNFGMSIDIKFYLPTSPGTRDADGGYGNQDIYGKDMHFRFSGDDDVWILVDGQLVLDIGGIHGIESGDINFSSGIVTTNGSQSGTITHLAPGDHTLTILYLERGSSQSNCSIFFNLAPRFSFSIQKEDVLTRAVLNGAQFSVYLDKACTIPAELWVNKASHDRGDPATNTFTVTNGTANMWGMGAGNTYYIKETKPPDLAEYTYARGIIVVTIDKKGQASYSVDLTEETLEDGTTGISNGFTVHGFRIDEETQDAYIVATNAPSWVTETTSIQVLKLWDDNQSHSGQSVTVYLTVTDRSGTVRRLQEIELSEANNWTHVWDNLPKYWEDGTTLVQYGTEESYVPGYHGKVELVDEYSVTTQKWQAVNKLENGKTYILKTSHGYLATQNSNADTGFQWVTEADAQSNPRAQWKVSVSGSTYRLTNGIGQIITFYYGNGSPTDFFAYTTQVQSNDNNNKQYLSVAFSGNSFQLYFPRPNSSTRYYVGSMLSNGKFDDTTSASSALSFTPMTLVTTTETVESTAGWMYQITNTPLDKETSLRVSKVWDYGYVVGSGQHQAAQVTVRLLANGKDTGRSVTLNLKNGWHATFQGLPYEDSDGNIIEYTVQETWQTDDWIPYYGDITVTPGDTPTYSAVVTNVYRWGTGAQLPSTGSAARMMYMLCGGAIMLASLVYGIELRRRRERRQK